MNEQEKIKEILEKWLDKHHNDYWYHEKGDYSAVSLDGYFDLQKLADMVRQQTLEEAIEIVEHYRKLIKYGKNDETDDVYEYGFKQTLSNLQALKDN